MKSPSSLITSQLLLLLYPMALRRYIICLTLLTWLSLLTITQSVRITNLKVPHIYTLERHTEPEPLVLDCEYELGPREKGFVLKWLFNNHSIYQWIPSVKGFAMGIMKSKINTEIFTLEGSPGVISIRRPDWNMTGEYTCFVQTFESTDKRSSRLQIIVPESDFLLETKMDGSRENVEVMCAVQNVFPQPVLSVIFDTKILDSVLTQMDQNASGLYSMTVRTRIPRDKLESPTPITCAFYLLGTNYTKRRETIFYGQIQSVTLDKTGKKSFGLSIVRGEAKDGTNSKGIFIKGIVPDSPGHLCGKIKVGDRLLTLNGKDVRDATEPEVINLIKQAGNRIDLEIQSYGGEQHNKDGNEIKENGFSQNRNMFNQASIKQAPMKQTPLKPQQSIKQAPGRPPNVNAMLKNSNITSNLNSKMDMGDDDDEDTRDMTGRIRTAAGIEIDRASAGNCKLNKMEKDRDKETEDEFGYTKAKINKRYNTMRDLRKLEITRPTNTALGLALAGHSDRQKMGCFVAGVNANGPLANVDIKPGDEILEVNGTVLKNRCHLNASVIFKNIDGERLVLITSRRKPGDEGMSVKTIKKFPPEIDDTKFLFEQFPKARSVQVKKEGFLGIMIIYGKHVEVGNGIFISDLREDSNAMIAGLKVGDMLLAVNKDVCLESNYDEAVALLKRCEGIVNLVVLTLKSDEQLKKEKEEEEKKKKKEEEATKEPEKPADPATVQVEPGRKFVLEIKTDKKPLGVIVVGGKNNYVKTGCVITHIYPEGMIAADNRLKIYDHIIQVNGKELQCEAMTTLKVHQLFYTLYEKIVTIQVFRADPPEVETFKVEFTKKAGKDLGLSLAPNEKGCTISEITSAGYADIDNKLQRGDIITKFNGDSLEGTTFEVCYALFRGATGKISLEITRPKPTVRTEPPK